MFLPLEQHDKKLIEAAMETLEKNYHPIRHKFAAAVLCSSGQIYTGINVESINGPCAETVAIGTAFTNGEREISSVVAVRKKNGQNYIVPPCGTCRQLLVIYSPEARVILNNEGELVKTQVKNLILNPYIRYRDKT